MTSDPLHRWDSGKGGPYIVSYLHGINRWQRRCNQICWPGVEINAGCSAGTPAKLGGPLVSKLRPSKMTSRSSNPTAIIWWQYMTIISNISFIGSSSSNNEHDASMCHHPFSIINHSQDHGFSSHSLAPDSNPFPVERQPDLGLDVPLTDRETQILVPNIVERSGGCGMVMVIRRCLKCYSNNLQHGNGTSSKRWLARETSGYVSARLPEGTWIWPVDMWYLWYGNLMMIMMDCPTLRPIVSWEIELPRGHNILAIRELMQEVLRPFLVGRVGIDFLMEK